VPEPESLHSLAELVGAAAALLGGLAALVQALRPPLREKPERTRKPRKGDGPS
jgi:hypothetical protein